MKSSGFVLALVLALVAAACGPKMPPKDSTEWLRRLEQGEVLYEAADVPGSTLEVGTATAVVNASPAVVWALLQDGDAFSEYLYQVKQSKELPLEGDDRLVELTIAPPAQTGAVLDDIHLKLRIKQKVDSGKLAWRAEYEMIEGNAERVYGAWVLEPFPGGRTAITFSGFHDFGYTRALDPAINFFTRQFLEKWALDVRDRLADPKILTELEKRAARWR